MIIHRSLSIYHILDLRVRSRSLSGVSRLTTLTTEADQFVNAKLFSISCRRIPSSEYVNTGRRMIHSLAQGPLGETRVSDFDDGGQVLKFSWWNRVFICVHLKRRANWLDVANGTKLIFLGVAKPKGSAKSRDSSATQIVLGKVFAGRIVKCSSAAFTNQI